MDSKRDNDAAITELLERAQAKKVIESSGHVALALRTFASILSAQGVAGRALSQEDTKPTAVADHLEDCLAGLTAIPGDWEGKSVVDVGSGYGLPGLVAGIARPRVARIALLEPSARRAAFLRRVAIETRVRADVIQRDASSEAERAAAGDGGFDIVLVRALAGPARTIALAAPLMREAGTLLYWFGRKDRARRAELSDASAAMKLDIEMFRPEMLESRGWVAIIRRCDRVR